MADSYEGPVRVRGGDGILLTTGSAKLEWDPEMATWTGMLQTLDGSAVAGKALIVQLEIPDGGVGTAQLVPEGESGDYYTSSVTGLGDRPF
jgi:hypothetical protein